MDYYRIQAGLPDRFRALGFRESNCINRDDVRTWCCHGYWQLYISLWLKDHRLGPRILECQVYSHLDVNSDDPIEKQKQACAAKAAFDVSQYAPWALS